jgi:protease-4
LLNNIYDLADNDKVKGVLLKVNCPGGEITASEAVYKAFSYVSSKKPLVASIQSAAASGGYMSILAANKIYSYDTSIVGSIGVMNGGFLDISGLEEKLGVKFFNYKSSPLKSLPDGFDLLGLRLSKKPSEDGEKHMQNIANEFQAIFKKMVEDNRPQIKDIELATNGEEFTGKRGLELGLIDVIGNDRDAMGDLQTNFNLKAELPIVDYNIIPPREESRSFFAKIIKIIWN